MAKSNRILLPVGSNSLTVQEAAEAFLERCPFLSGDAIHIYLTSGFLVAP